MKAKTWERELATSLRKQGCTYNEILMKVPVAKSTLSVWLRSVGLAKKQEQRLTRKKLEAIKRGNKAWRNIRIERTKRIKKKARSEVGGVSKRELWLIGIALYWAEGTKQNENGRSQGAYFSNSDPRMLRVYYRWLTESLQLFAEQISIDLFIHENNKHRLNVVIEYWARELKIPNKHNGFFDHVYYKKHNIKTVRKKTGENYFGLVRIVVKKSTDLNRKISGWIEGVSLNAE